MKNIISLVLDFIQLSDNKKPTWYPIGVPVDLQFRNNIEFFFISSFILHHNIYQKYQFKIIQ